LGKKQFFFDIMIFCLPTDEAISHLYLLDCFVVSLPTYSSQWQRQRMNLVQLDLILSRIWIFDYCGTGKPAPYFFLDYGKLFGVLASSQAPRNDLRSIFYFNTTEDFNLISLDEAPTKISYSPLSSIQSW